MPKPCFLTTALHPWQAPILAFDRKAPGEDAVAGIWPLFGLSKVVEIVLDSGLRFRQIRISSQGAVHGLVQAAGHLSAEVLHACSYIYALKGRVETQRSTQHARR